MKKLILIISCLCFLLSGCSHQAYTETQQESNISMFVTIEETYDWLIVYHKETKVMYSVSKGRYNRGNIIMLVNSDGTPLLYEKGGEG